MHAQDINIPANSQKIKTNINKHRFSFFSRMLAPKILARIMQHAKLGLQTEIISVCVLLDLDLKVITVMRVRNPLQFFQVEQKINA